MAFDTQKMIIPHKIGIVYVRILFRKLAWLA